jgi:hypothetical protein
MAQSKSFFGLRRGSTKSLTFSVFNGKQVTKDRVDTVKNPRSELQMIQRMFFGTTCRAYSAMKQIVDHSFEGYSYGLKNMMHFASINEKRLKALEADPAKDPVFNSYQSTVLAANPYIIAQGSATPISKSISVALVNNAITTVLTPAEMQALTANNILAAYGFGVGELMTICFIWQDFNGEANFDFIRVTSLKAGDVALTAANLAEYFLIESSHSGLSVTISNEGTEQQPDWRIVISCAEANIENEGSVFVGVIHSVKTDGGWLRSNTTLAGADSFGGSLYDDALATYPVGQSYVLNGGDI